MFKNMLGAAALAAILLAASSADADTHSIEVDKFEWVSGECVAVLKGGKLKEVMDGVDEADCAQVRSVAEVPSYVDKGVSHGKLATLQSKSSYSHVCWHVGEVCGN